MYKDDEKMEKIIKEKEKINEQVNQLKIKNKNFNTINFLNFQHYYDLIDKLRKEDIFLNTDFLDNFTNINNTFHKQRMSPFFTKIRKDINQISKHIYKDNKKDIDKDNDFTNKKFLDKFKHIINSKSVSPSTKSKINKYEKNLKNKIPIKIFYFHEKDKKMNNINKTINKEKMRNNTVDSITNRYDDIDDNKGRKKFEYQNYALNSTNFKHPQYYVLNTNYNNNSIDRERLPLIERPNGFKFKKSRDLSYLIPFNTKKRKVRDNFYSYYIGMKLTKQKF